MAKMAATTDPGPSSLALSTDWESSAVIHMALPATLAYRAQSESHNLGQHRAVAWCGLWSWTQLGLSSLSTWL